MAVSAYAVSVEAAEGGADIRFSLLIAALASMTLAGIWLISWAIFHTPLAFLRPADDAYYYFDVALHATHHAGTSTDGIHSTNGFHPLWFLLLLPFAAVFSQPSQGLVVIGQAFSCLAFGVAIAGLAATARRAAVPRFAAGFAALLLFFPSWRGIVGAVLEGGLALALLAWTAFAAQRVLDDVRVGRSVRVSALWFGILAGLSILARLDDIWVIGCLCLLLVGVLVRDTANGEFDFRSLAFVAGIPAAILGGYLLINVAEYGRLLPISGYIKTSFPRVSFAWSSYLQSFKAYFLLLVIGYAGCIVAARVHHRAMRLLVALSIGGTLQALYVLCFSAGVFWWHFVSLVPCGILGLAVIFDVGLARVGDTRRNALKRWSVVIAIVLLVFSVSLTLISTSPLGDRLATSGWRIEAERAASWASAHLPHDAMLAMRDSGAFGYYTVQPVMNLDGVSSSYGYERALCHNGAIEAMRRAGVVYVAYHALPAKPYAHFVLSFSCHENGRRTRLRFVPSDEVYRGRKYWQHYPAYFVIWRFDADRQSDQQ